MSIKWKILALYVLLGCVPIATSAYFYSQYKNLVRNNAMARLDAVATNLKARMALVNQLNSERLAGVTSRTQLRITYERYLETSTPKDKQKILHIIGDALTSIPSFKRIILTSPNGLQSISTDGQIPSVISYLIFSAKASPTHTSTHILFQDGMWQLALVGPMRKNDKLLGYGILYMGAEDIFTIASTDAYFQQSGEVFLVTRDNGRTEFLNTQNPAIPITSPALEAALNGEARSFTDLTDIHGTPIIAASRYADDFNLGLVLTVNQSEVFGAFQNLQKQQIALCFILILPALFIAFLIARSVYHPLSRLKSIAEKVGLGDWSIRANSKTNDEIGELARSFDKMLEELEKSNQKQIAANQDLTHFTHIAAHDLREPARKGVGLAQLLELAISEGDLEEAKKIANFIGASSNRMLGMIDDFRQLTNIGTNELVREACNLKSIINSVLADHKEELDARQIIISFDEFPATNLVYQSLIHLLYDNLIKNALQHVSADNFSLHFSCRLINEQFTYGVQNTGSTVTKDAQKTIFKMFRTQKKTAASGIGLTICKKIVDRHKGRIWVESNDNATHFHFTLE